MARVDLDRIERELEDVEDILLGDFFYGLNHKERLEIAVKHGYNKPMTFNELNEFMLKTHTVSGVVLRWLIDLGIESMQTGKLEDYIYTRFFRYDEEKDLIIPIEDDFLYDDLLEYWNETLLPELSLPEKIVIFQEFKEKTSHSILY